MKQIKYITLLLVSLLGCDYENVSLGSGLPGLSVSCYEMIINENYPEPKGKSLELYNNLYNFVCFPGDFSGCAGRCESFCEGEPFSNDCFACLDSKKSEQYTNCINDL